MVEMAWFNEGLHLGYGQRMRIDKLLFETTSAHQQLMIFENPVFGRVLALDGIVQTTEKDEYIYHELFAHVPLVSHANPQNVLIVGGGDGGLLREVLKHTAVKSVTLVEIDQQVIDLCTTYLPQHSQGAFADSRVRVVIEDGMAFVRESEQQFDVILSDSTDPIGPGEVLFSDDFYAHCQRCLKPGGVLVTQNGVSFLQLDEIATTHQRMAQLYAQHGFYSAAVPSYIGGPMHFAWASDTMDLKVLAGEVGAYPELATRHYQQEIHQGAFALAKTVTDVME